MDIQNKIKAVYEKTGEKWAKFGKLPEDFINLIKENSNKSYLVLDVGCGGGRLSVSINNFVKKVVAIDYSNESIKHAKKENKRENIDYLVMDANNLLFNENTFDMVVSHAVFNKKMCGAKALKECYRVLKPNGKLIVKMVSSDFGKEFGLNLGYSKQEISKILKNQGYKKVKVKVEKVIKVLKSFEDLKFYERTEVGALISPEKMLKRFNKLKNPKFNDSFMVVYAEK